MELQLDRLKIWERYLRNDIAPKQFCIDYWWKPLRGVRDCDTVACALGWACQIPELNALGLALDHLERPTFTTADGVKYTDTDAVVQCFGLTFCEADRVVYPWMYAAKSATTAEMVADRICEIIRERQED